METAHKQSARSAFRDLLIAWGPAVLWMAVIFYLSAQGSLGGQKWAPIFMALRKSAHIFEYAVLAMLIGFGLLRTWGAAGHRLSKVLLSRAWVLGTALSTIYAVSDEFHQSFVPGRGAHVEDVIIDALSSVVGLGLVYIWSSYRLSHNTLKLEK